MATIRLIRERVIYRNVVRQKYKERLEGDGEVGGGRDTLGEPEDSLAILTDSFKDAINC